MAVMTEHLDDADLATFAKWCRERETLPLLGPTDLQLWRRQSPAEFAAAVEDYVSSYGITVIPQLLDHVWLDGSTGMTKKLPLRVVPLAVDQPATDLPARSDGLRSHDLYDPEDWCLGVEEMLQTSDSPWKTGTPRPAAPKAKPDEKVSSIDLRRAVPAEPLQASQWPPPREVRLRMWPWD